MTILAWILIGLAGGWLVHASTSSMGTIVGESHGLYMFLGVIGASIGGGLHWVFALQMSLSAPLTTLGQTYALLGAVLVAGGVKAVTHYIPTHHK